MSICAVCLEEDVKEDETVHLGLGKVVHIRCFKCSKCSVQLTPSDKADRIPLYCKDHKVGLAKQISERARRSFRGAALKGSKFFTPTQPSKKKNDNSILPPPLEVGVPATVAIDTPPATPPTLNQEEEEGESRNQEGDEFVTILEDGEDSMISEPALSRNNSSAIPTTISSHASPSMFAFGEVASTIPTIVSTIISEIHPQPNVTENATILNFGDIIKDQAQLDHVSEHPQLLEVNQEDEPVDKLEIVVKEPKIAVVEEEDEEDEEEEEGNKKSKGTDPLNVLTAAVARELEVLPQSTQKIGDSDEDVDNIEQPWVYPPAYAGVSPIQISVVDPDHLWTFLESPLLERMAHSKVGGARRAKFITSDALKPVSSVAVHSRYRNPSLHLYLVRCESLQEYTSTIRPRLRAFKEDVEKREDPEWLICLVESSPTESKKMIDKIKQDFPKDRVGTVSVCDDIRRTISAENSVVIRPSGDGQWGDLAQRVGTCIVRAYENRKPLYKSLIDEELSKEYDINYFNIFVRTESLAFASLQVDRNEEALELYSDLNTRFRRHLDGKDPLIEKIVRSGMTDDSGSTVKRSTCSKLLFPPVSIGSTEQDAYRIQIHRTFPARVFDVERHPFRDLIASCTISGIQLQMYLLSRIVLNLLALGRAREAVETSRQFIVALRTNLRTAYPIDLTCVDAWFVAATLEVVAAGHACASVFASEVEPVDRVGMCLAQASLLERAKAALEDISRRESPSENKNQFIPELATNIPSECLKQSNLPKGLTTALFSSPESFRNMYSRLLEAGAAHYVAAGRFRFAANLTHRRACLLTNDEDAIALFQDAGRWWSGEQKVLVLGEGTASDQGYSKHDDWPSLRTETALSVKNTSLVSQVAQLIFPSYRRQILSDSIREEILNGNEKLVLPIEIISNVTNQVTEDEEWVGTVSLRWTLPELMDIVSEIEKISVVFRKRNLEMNEKEEEEMIEFLSEMDLQTATSCGKIANVGNYTESNAFVYIGGKRFHALLSPKRTNQHFVTVKERKFPWILNLKKPTILSSGTCFVKEEGEYDSVTTRQEFTLSISKRNEPSCRESMDDEYNICLNCSEGFEFAEREGKVFTTTLILNNKNKFDDNGRINDEEHHYKFCLVAVSKDKQQKGTGEIKAEMHYRGRELVQVFQFQYQAPVKVAHDIRFAQGDVAAISLIIESNLEDSAIEVCNCSLAPITSNSEIILKSPEKPEYFPFKLYTPLHQAFLMYNLGAIVPERAGGQTLILLSCSIQIRFLHDLSECVLSWNVPLVIRRAQVVRTRWGESLIFSPPIEDARFGLDWVEEDDELPPTISIISEEDAVE